MPSQPLGPTPPSIGRIVHIELPPVTVPAIVTAVIGSDGAIMATAFPPGTAPVIVKHAAHHEPEPGQPTPAGTWHWPLIR